MPKNRNIMDNTEFSLLPPWGNQGWYIDVCNYALFYTFEVYTLTLLDMCIVIHRNYKLYHIVNIIPQDILSSGIWKYSFNTAFYSASWLIIKFKEWRMMFLPFFVIFIFILSYLLFLFCYHVESILFSLSNNALASILMKWC